MAETVLFSADEIAARVREMGQAIDARFPSSRPLFVGILGGGLVLLGDLLRAVTVPNSCAFLMVSTYPGSGEPRVVCELAEGVKGRDVILVDGAVVSGKTHQYLVEWFRLRGAASVSLCAAVAKEHVPGDLPLTYIGFRSDAFAVGYGIAHDGAFRGLPYIAQYQPPKA